MLYFINNGHELIKVAKADNKVTNLHTKESNQVAYRPMYLIREDGTIMYHDNVTHDGQRLKVKAGDVVVILNDGVPFIIKDKAFGLALEMFFIEVNKQQTK